ncbi:MAG: transposase [Myxococcota bacterium]
MSIQLPFQIPPSRCPVETGATSGFGKEAKLCFIGHVLSENRNGLIVDMDLTQASGTAERDAALRMLDEALPTRRQRTLNADAGYHTRAFIAELRDEEARRRRRTDDASGRLREE